MRTAILAVHIPVGALGLVLGPLLLVLARRPAWHTRVGLAYQLAVAVVCVTALGLVVLRPEFSELVHQADGRLLRRPGDGGRRRQRVLAAVVVAADLGRGADHRVRLSPRCPSVSARLRACPGTHRRRDRRSARLLGRRLRPRHGFFGHANVQNNRHNGHETPLSWPRRRLRGQGDARMAKGTASQG